MALYIAVFGRGRQSRQRADQDDRGRVDPRRILCWAKAVAIWMGARRLTSIERSMCVRGQSIRAGSLPMPALSDQHVDVARPLDQRSTSARSARSATTHLGADVLRQRRQHLLAARGQDQVGPRFDELAGDRPIRGRRWRR